MMQDIVKIFINETPYEVDSNATILKACADNGIKIPTLCFLEKLNEEAACSICLVEVKGAKTLQRACITKVIKNMEIHTHTTRVLLARKTILQLILANHPKECLSCSRNSNCELQSLACELGVDFEAFEKTKNTELKLDYSSDSIIRDPNKCILCKRCVAVCSNIQTVNVINTANRGIYSTVTTPNNKGLGTTHCVNCGQCLLVCPTGAITEKSEVNLVWQALNNTNKFVVVQTAPAVRVAIGEEFGMPAGSLVTGKMTSALKKLGFNRVFDTQFTADLTIIEEGNELIHRIKNNGKLPLITSCSPGWIKFAEHFFPNSLCHISSCKSPQQMFGTVAKTYYSEKFGIDPRNIVVVSIMPCTAKKYEARRPDMDSAYYYWKEKLNLKDSEHFVDVDYVLTTREAAQLIKQAGIDFASLTDDVFDHPLGESTGAATIFGASGGVMEAALRTAYELVTGKKLDAINFESVRGLQGIKTAEVDLNGLILKVAVANSLMNARILLEEIERGNSPYHFIEIMCCPGGCIGGGGQPIPTNDIVKGKRAKALYCEDEGKPIRKSHENPDITKIYEDFLKEPLGHLSHELLHTKYICR